MTGNVPDTLEDGALASQISTKLTSLLKERLGRGPTEAKTYIGKDIVTCVLRNTMTPADKTLVIIGEGKLVHDSKQLLQGAMRQDMIDLIEGLVGRPVLAYLSDHDVARDIAAEVFVLDESDGERQDSD